MIGVDEPASGAAELDLLRDAGADLMLVPLAEGPVYHNVETPTGRVQTCVRPGIPLPIPAFPDSWLAAPAWQLAPVAGEITDDWAAAVPADAYLAVAWQGFLRTLVAGERVTRRAPRPSPILAPGGPRRGQPSRRRPGHADRGPDRGSSGRAPGWS